MSNIKIANLHSANSDLSSDSESFMYHPSDSDIDNITGGVVEGGCIRYPIPYPLPKPYPDPFDSIDY